VRNNRRHPSNGWFGTGYKPLAKKLLCASNYHEFVEYIIDMSDDVMWGGDKLYTLRFDPIGDGFYDEGTIPSFDLEYISISAEPPMYSSRKSFCNTQGVNGWSYFFEGNNSVLSTIVWDNKNNIWHTKTNKILHIGKDLQSSNAESSSIRRWTCPIDGNYLLKYIVKFDETNSGQELIIRNNEKVVKKVIKNNCFTDSSEIYFQMKKNDIMDFVYINYSYDPLEIRIDLTIEKRL
jgi:hypothetical protein